MRVAFRLIPKEERFYDDFTAMAEQIRVGATLLTEMLAPEKPIWDKADEIKEVEHQCDNLTHQIIQRLNRTFVTPIDRVRPDARVLAGIIKTSVDQLVKALKALEKKVGVSEPAVEINRLENEA